MKNLPSRDGATKGLQVSVQILVVWLVGRLEERGLNAIDCYSGANFRRPSIRSQLEGLPKHHTLRHRHRLQGQSSCLSNDQFVMHYYYY